jgi:ubiquinone/menaquinone biosynthesis C-methylase UbiE
MNNDVTRPICQSYDKIAEAYARELFGELKHKPFDQELLDRFAAGTLGRGQVCDKGCGPGQVARYLHDAGASVFGLDLSPRMIEVARRFNPNISFREGNMMALDLPDTALTGIAAFYAIVNIPEESLTAVFREMHRVLQPGGLLLMAFHIGTEVIQKEELRGQVISMDFFFFQPLSIRLKLEAVGFAIEEIIEREPYAPEVEYQSRRAYIYAKKPG